MKKIWSIVFIFSLLVLQLKAACSQLDTVNQQRLEFGHVLFIKNITTIPYPLIPGKGAILKMTLENTGRQVVSDIVVTLNLTSEFSIPNDISRKKIASLSSAESKEVEYGIIALPSTSEGAYKAKLTVDYVNHIGEERQDSGEIGLVVKGAPSIFAQIEKSGIYKGADVGVITIKFVNNGVGDAKFLTVELLKSENYEIISSNKEYIGDLDSDDFESVDFRIKVNEEKTTNLILKADYRDSLNEDYSQDFNLPLEIRTAKEIGIKTNGTAYIILVSIIMVILLYVIYKKYGKKKKRTTV